jgi:hypothetical protein
MSERLPTWYIDDLRQEILRLRETLKQLENGNGSVGGKVLGSLTPDTIDRHTKAIAELQSILDDDNEAII